MENKILNNKFESLPLEAQKQVFAFIDFLQNKYFSTSKEKRLKALKVVKRKFIGIWKDRIELKDSLKYVRNLRRNEWERLNG